MNYSRFCNQMLIIFFFGVSFSSPQPENDFYSESWALLIGINKYHNETHLNYAVADAERMHRLLTEKLDFPADNVFMLLDEEATLINIKKEMKKLYEVANDSDRVLIYFAGHGITEPLPKGGEEGYLIPIEGDKDDLYTTALPMSEMKRISKRVSAKDMLFLMDACYSGLMGVGNRGLSLDESADMSLRKIAAGGSRTVITAGRKGEIAQENAEWGHSPFVKNIVSGLEKGMADFNDDNYITARELGMYLTNQVTADTDNKQTPDVSYFTTDRGEFVFIIGDINLKLEDSKLTSSPSLEIDYDKLAEKIADRMESKKSYQTEQNDEEVEETVAQSYPEAEDEILEETRNMDLLEKEMYKLSEEMTALGDVMTELGEEMTSLGEEIEAEEEEEREALAEEMEVLGEEMEVLGEMMEEVGKEMEEVGKEMEDMEGQDEDIEDTVNDIIEGLKKLGIDIESEEISKMSGGVGNEIKNKIGLTQGKLIANCTFANSQTRYYADEPENEDDIITTADISNNNWWGYNRSEGLFYQLNGVFQSPNIKGSSFYGGVGRAFHRNEYQGILGLEQLMFNNIFQFYAEVFNKSITQDAWRLWDGENSLSTIFRRQDYLDWYRGQGYRTAGFVHIKNYVSIGAEYNQVAQSEMNNVLEGDKFREAYKVQEGDNIFLKTIVSAGYPVELSVRDKFQMYSTIIRTSSMENADMNYTYDHFYLNLLIPYAEKLNFNIKVMVGASDVDSSIWDTSGYHQHIFEIGGEGTLRGYDWKVLPSSHYQLTTLETWFGFVGVFYDRAILFKSQGNVFNAAFFSDLSDNITQDVKSSMGFILGRKNLRLSFTKQMTGDKNSTIYLTFGSPLQYW